MRDVPDRWAVLVHSGWLGIARNNDHFALAAHPSWVEQPRAGVRVNELEDILNG